MAFNISKSVVQTTLVRDQLLNQPGGKWLLHQQFPNDFEYYMCAFELLDSNLKTLAYFIFPIMPNSLNYNNIPLTKVTKTAGGVSVLKNKQFVPKSLTISGTFGRSFKVLIGNEYQDLISGFSEIKDDIFKGSFKTGGKKILENFSDSVKTGYGCTKVLETILNESNQPDILGKNKYLIFYNLAFNQSFFVEYEDETYSMAQDTNMIWQYSIKLKAIAPSNNYLKDRKGDVKSNKQLVIDDLIQRNANKAYGKATTFLNNTLPSFI